MAYNKIIYGGKTLLDLTSDTVTADKMLKGTTAHDKSGVVVTGTCTYDADTKDGTANPAEILSGRTAYVNGTKLTGIMPNRGRFDAVIQRYNDEIQIPQGYHDGSGTVMLDVSTDAFTAQNIKAGVTILGLTGTYSGEMEHPIELTLTPTKDGSGELYPNSYTHTIGGGMDLIEEFPGDHFSKVKLNPIPYNETQNAAGGTTVNIAYVTDFNS